MKKKLLSVAMLAVLAAGCAPNYSNGERSGVVIKLSEKGFIWKSWEGSMLVALPAGMMSQPEAFTFNVDPATVPKVQAALASGQRVTLVYRQWALNPPSIENNHVIVDVR